MAPVSGCSPTATHSLQDMSAAAAAIALDMKPKGECHPLAAVTATALPSQKIKKRREFNAPGRRVARAFKSLRESYRRELAHVKLMGNGFKPKWSLYEAMDFLRDVIRERKGASHATDLSLTAYGHIHSNNNNNSSSMGVPGKAVSLKLSTPFNESAAVLNLSKCSSLNVSGDDYYCDYYVKPELDLTMGGAGSSSSGSSSGGGPLPLPAHQHQVHNDSRVSSTRNEHQHLQNSYDDIDASSIHSGDEDPGHVSDGVEELEAIDADFPYPLILDSNSRGSTNAGVDEVASSRKRRRNVEQDGLESGNGDGDAVIDGDDYEEQMLQQHRHLRQQQGAAVTGGLDLPPPQTVREVLNSKFCGFISAKLNSMEDSEADNLMNRILLLLVQVQQCEGSTK
ncbi:hypothetical protein M5D96_011567 [Drosophila gunungcola]|uniref:MADF domain-containing protein n=1 Tax=Drosophila gunungcola TaxID=103775 RepID=A0A9P9YFJ5_9MUSC|nr:hypothetical protein M5D96_011567 [Drosophila gunungcola]